MQYGSIHMRRPSRHWMLYASPDAPPPPPPPPPPRDKVTTCHKRRESSAGGSASGQPEPPGTDYYTLGRGFIGQV
eukprot:7525837-Pyramimonas_sp.AAC.1